MFNLMVMEAMRQKWGDQPQLQNMLKNNQRSQNSQKQLPPVVVDVALNNQLQVLEDQPVAQLNNQQLLPAQVVEERKSEQEPVVNDPQ